MGSDQCCLHGPFQVSHGLQLLLTLAVNHRKKCMPCVLSFFKSKAINSLSSYSFVVFWKYGWCKSIETGCLVGLPQLAKGEKSGIDYSRSYKVSTKKVWRTVLLGNFNYFNLHWFPLKWLVPIEHNLSTTEVPGLMWLLQFCHLIKQ